MLLPCRERITNPSAVCALQGIADLDLFPKSEHQLMTLKILYVPVPHEVQEYDDLLLFTKLGHRVFSLGKYWNRADQKYNARKPRESFYDEELTKIFQATSGCRPAPDRIVTFDFCNNFDVVYVCDNHGWLLSNVHLLNGIPIIFRTNGQSDIQKETALKGLGDRIKIVRYSQKEVDLPGFAKTDAVIYFGKEVSEFPHWKGGQSSITLHSHFPTRDKNCCPNMSEYAELIDGFDVRLHGLSNDGAPACAGHLPPEMLYDALSLADCYLYVWSRSPSYTMSLMEAMLVGTPVIAPSRQFVCRYEDRDLTAARYEVEDFLSNGCGLVYDSIEEGRQLLREIIGNDHLQKSISSLSRERAINLFSNEIIAPQWEQLLHSVVSRNARISR